MLDWLITLNIIKNMSANQILFHKKYLVRILLLFMRLNKFFVAIHETKQVLIFNRPIQAGFGNLELTKYLMYDLHYNYIKRNYNAKLLFTDTENLVYEIEKK